MPFTGFSTRSTSTLWILSKHSKPQPVWCALPLLLYSTEHLHPFTCLNLQLRAFPFRGLHGWSEPGAASLLCSCGRCFIQSWKNCRSGCQESRVRWRQNENNYNIICHIGKVQWIWFFLSSLLLRLLSEFSPRLTPAVPPFQVSSRLHSRFCGDQRDHDASLHSLLRQ